jgi:uroporphyrinogen-III synthase
MSAGPFQAVVTTSSNAVRALTALGDRGVPSATPLFAVGDHTALEAKRAGFAAVRSAGGTLDHLVGLVGKELTPSAGTLLYAAGEVQAGDLVGRLAELGFTVETAIVYRAAPRPRLAAVAEAALRGNRVDGILLYSLRSAEALVNALSAAALAPLPGRVTCFCLSPAIAAVLPAVTRGPILVAERPDQISLFALIERAG